MHPTAGHPESLEIGVQTYYYVYDAKGRAVSRAGKYTDTAWSMSGHHDDPVSVSEIVRDDKGAEFARRESRFI